MSQTASPPSRRLPPTREARLSELLARLHGAPTDPALHAELEALVPSEPGRRRPWPLEVPKAWAWERLRAWVLDDRRGPGAFMLGLPALARREDELLDELRGPGWPFALVADARYLTTPERLARQLPLHAPGDDGGCRYEVPDVELDGGVLVVRQAATWRGLGGAERDEVSAALIYRVQGALLHGRVARWSKPGADGAQRLGQFRARR